MSQTIKAAILGAGFMGGMHAKNLAALEGVEVVAVCSGHKESAENLASDLPGEVASFDDFDAMLDQVDFNALVVCLPPFAHNGQVEKAAARGIDLFLEKPIAISPEKGRKMLEAIEQGGVRAMVGYHMRYGAAVAKLKGLIEDGTAGRPTLFDARYECRMTADSKPWWAKKEGSGGQILEQIIHLYDMGMYLFGAPSTVTGLAANICHGEDERYTIEDTSIGSVQFQSGAMATIAGSNCGVQWEWNNPFTVICENLTARFTDANTAEFIYTGGEETRRENIEADTDMYAEEIQDFVALLRGEKTKAPTAQEGLLGLTMVDAVLQSSAYSAKPIKL